MTCLLQPFVFSTSLWKHTCFYGNGSSCFCGHIHVHLVHSGARLSLTCLPSGFQGQGEPAFRLRSQCEFKATPRLHGPSWAPGPSSQAGGTVLTVLRGRGPPPGPQPPGSSVSPPERCVSERPGPAGSLSLSSRLPGRLPGRSALGQLLLVTPD